ACEAVGSHERGLAEAPRFHRADASALGRCRSGQTDVGTLCRGDGSLLAEKVRRASVNERLALLTEILNGFQNSSVDVSIAQSEYEIAKSDRAKAETDLQISWNYYQKIVARGASVPERIQLLGRMIERFARTGVDLTNLKTELKSLQGGR